MLCLKHNQVKYLTIIFFPLIPSMTMLHIYCQHFCCLLNVKVMNSVLCFPFISSESKFSNFWNVILDEKKPLFTTEKFLSQASEESKTIFAFHIITTEDQELIEISKCEQINYILLFALICLALLTVLLLCERLFLDHAHRLNTSRSQSVCLTLKC